MNSLSVQGLRHVSHVQPYLRRREMATRRYGFDGFGSFVTMEQMARAENIGGVTDWVTSLFGGKPQSWWSEVDSIQKDLLRVSNDISAIGQTTWDNIQYDLAGFYSRGEEAPYGFDGRFPGYEFMMSESSEALKKMIVTSDRAPSDADIVYGRTLIATGKPAVEFAQKYAPEVQARVANDRAVLEGQIGTTPLRSPESVGVDTFAEEVSRRAALMAKAAGGAAGSVLNTVLLIGGIAVAGLLLMNMLKK